MSAPLVRLTVEAGVARLVLNRPDKRNALSRALLEQLTEAVAGLASDESVRLVVLAAEGPAFCAGMDLGEMQARAGHPEASRLWREDTQIYRDLLAGLLTLRCPTLAVVQGAAVAGGLGLVLACDMVLAAESAFFALPEPKRGITAAIVTPLLVHRVGPGPAGYLLLSGRVLSAADAHRFGLCHELVPETTLADRTQQLAASVLSGAPSALALTKRHLLECAASDLVPQLDAAMALSAQARETADAREGLAAFLDKREPAWSAALKSAE